VKNELGVSKRRHIKFRQQENFRCALNLVYFLLGDSPASEFYMPTFRGTLFHIHRRVGVKNELGVSKRRYIKFRRQENCRCALKLVYFLLGNSPASEFSMPTFRSTLFHIHRQVGVKN